MITLHDASVRMSPGQLRVARCVKWGGLAACVLLAVVILRSLAVPYKLFSFRTYPDLGIVQGSVYYCEFNAVFSRDEQFFFVGDINRFAPALWWRHKSSVVGYRLTVPLWMFGLPLLIFTATAWRLDDVARYRLRRGLCVKCGYARSGLEPTHPCPECGSRIDARVAAK